MLSFQTLTIYGNNRSPNKPVKWNLKVIRRTKNVLTVMEFSEGLNHTLDFGFNSSAITVFITVILQIPFFVFISFNIPTLLGNIQTDESRLQSSGQASAWRKEQLKARKSAPHSSYGGWGSCLQETEDLLICGRIKLVLQDHERNKSYLCTGWITRELSIILQLKKKSYENKKVGGGKWWEGGSPEGEDACIHRADSHCCRN